MSNIIIAVKSGGQIIAVKGDSDEWALDVLGVPYYGPHSGRDTHGEFFDTESDLWYEDGHSLPVIHYHGLREKDPEIIGKTTKYWKTAEGHWWRVVLDKSSAKAREMWEAAQKGKARASSGALNHLRRVNERTGQIRIWPLGELSLMDSSKDAPANEFAVALPAYKSAYEQAGFNLPDYFKAPGELPEGGSSATEVSTKAEEEVSTLDHQKVKTMTLEELKALLQGLIDQLSGTAEKMEEEDPESVKMEEEDKEEAAEAVAAKALELLKKDSAFKADMDESAIKALVQTVADNHMEELAEAYFNAAFDRRQQREAVARKAAKAARTRFEKNAPPTFKGEGAGGVKRDLDEDKPDRISVGENLKYAHLSAADMAMAVMLRTAPIKKAGIPYTLGGIGLSDDFLNTLAGKAADYAQSKPFDDVLANNALKAAVPWKADELVASDIAGQGDEWTEVVLSATIWEKARNQRIYQQLISRGMMERPVPQGAEAVDIPTEGSDPIAYSSPQASSVDSTGRPEVTANINPFGTGNVRLTPGEIKIATAYTVVAEEDLIIALAPQVNKQLTEKAEETIEQLMLNGDSVVTANTNINLIDGTPTPTGISRPYYLATNGILKYALVTGSGTSRSAGGTLKITDYLNTRKLMPKEIRDRLDKLVFVIDSDTNMKTLGLPELTTKDVAAQYATIEAGEVKKIWGIPVYITGFMELANSAGKVPTAGGTLGRMSLVYPPYWAFAFKRQVTLETDRDILSGSNIYVASFRMGMAARGAGSSVATYNIGVS